MEASDGSSHDGKSMTYSEAIAIHRKHLVAVSIKMETSGGSKYKMRCCPRLPAAESFPYVYNALRIVSQQQIEWPITSASRLFTL